MCVKFKYSSYLCTQNLQINFYGTDSIKEYER